MIKKFVTDSPETTHKLGKALGAKLRRGDVVAFFGGLGMGKTAFTRGIADGMGLDCHVSSPTFAIVNVYNGSPKLCHFDMYRIDGWDDLCTTGFFEYLEDDAVLAVEWSENIENVLPENTLFVTITNGTGETERIFTFEGDERLEDISY
ncbi:MAG: tRNA (adenosine(37)-N6)-threonylcarbamoyltransferase complex ATPase subunit type 1 TsaE [Clostridia bacterium]|nr:tRNA (adenosine(37)-N6)-threonylcarbamoyltransferase complex ATPase subunit type 1 TsaE [Clostridia bacterium]